MRFLSTVIILLVLVTGLNFAQVTTGNLAGKVFDSKNAPLKSATVTAIHVPSGTKYGAIVRADGRFNIPSMRVGGPYSVTATFTGYERKTFDNVQIQLGSTTDLTFVLVEAGVRTEEVVVIGKQDAVFNSERTGAATTITSAQLSELPTITRRVSDFTRLNPMAKNTNFGTSFGGQDNRLNNVTIDGSYINNLFGLSGDPGGRTNVAPISIDALEQIQVNIAPYDVRQANFTGAGVNMVTKSGTNEFSGSLFYQLRNESFVGTEAASSKFNPGKFNFHNIGATLGGPVIKDKLFFFANFETEANIFPGTTYLANDGTQTSGGNITRVLASDLNNLSSFLKEKFNYETGGYQGYDFETPALRFILKFDYNLDQNNKISLRYNHLNSKTDVLASNSSSLGSGSRNGSINALNFQNSNYAIMENIRSIVAEWSSVISDNMTNNMIVGYRFHDESREQPGKLFPFVDILKDGGSTYTSFGTEPFTPSNKLTYSTFQFQNNFNWYLKDHNLLFGISIESYESENVFFPGSQSVYIYNSLDDFYTDANDYIANPNRTTSPVTLKTFQYRYANIPGQTEPVQPLKVLYGGIYAQDDWSVMDNFKLTAGIRVDLPMFSETGFKNDSANSYTFKDEDGKDVKYSTEKLPNASPLFSPRIGFNWDVFKNKTTQVRGGSGIFTGIPAFVWISNQIGNNGVMTGFENITNTTTRPFNPNPNAYTPENITGAPASSYELALTDPDFKFPQIWRTNLGIDQKLPLDFIGTFEFLYNKDINGVYYINANLPAAQTNYKAEFDQRERWTANRINSKITNATVLKNQNVGYSYSLAFSLERNFANGIYGKVGYAYGVSKNTVDAGSIAFGSWSGNAMSGNPNNPGVSFSAYTPDNRLFAALSYKLDYFNIGTTTLSLFFESFTAGRSSYIFSGDYNGDGATNDLIYIPKYKSEMRFETYTTKVNNKDVTFTKEQQEEAWEKYIQQDEYLSANRGSYAERNGVILPMVTRLDLGLSQEFYTEFFGKRNGLEIRLDVLNFTNLLNKEWGVGQTLVNARPLINRPATTEGQPVYRLVNVGENLINKSFTNTVSINDVYRLQLTLRYKFN